MFSEMSEVCGGRGAALEQADNKTTVFKILSEDSNSWSIEKEVKLPPIDINISKDWINNSKTCFGKNINTEFSGPTIDSNIIIPKHITVGGYPDRHNDIKNLKEFGITKFVCLNDEYGKVPKCPVYDNKLEDGKFVHFPLKDMATTIDISMIDLCRKLAIMIFEGEHLYIHCSGGHGRTGTVVGILLKLLYNWLSVDDILNYIQYSHDQRKYFRYGCVFHTKYIWDSELKNKFDIGQVPTPQTSEQRYQILRICNMF